jgi:hypothetical protein
MQRNRYSVAGHPDGMFSLQKFDDAGYLVQVFSLPPLPTTRLFNGRRAAHCLTEWRIFGCQATSTDLLFKEMTE